MEVVNSWDRSIRRWSRNVNSNAGTVRITYLIVSFYSWYQELGRVAHLMPKAACQQACSGESTNSALVLNKIDEWRMIVYVNGRC